MLLRHCQSARKQKSGIWGSDVILLPLAVLLTGCVIVVNLHPCGELDSDAKQHP